VFRDIGLGVGAEGSYRVRAGCWLERLTEIWRGIGTVGSYNDRECCSGSRCLQRYGVL